MGSTPGHVLTQLVWRRATIYGLLLSIVLTRWLANGVLPDEVDESQSLLNALRFVIHFGVQGGVLAGVFVVFEHRQTWRFLVAFLIGAALLSALEKRDNEELSLLRSRHEVSMLKLVGDTRQRQVDEAEANVAYLRQLLAQPNSWKKLARPG